MYSWEIDNFFKSHNFCIEPCDYFKICNTSPQINFIKYDSFNNNFYISTNDGFNWTFILKKLN